MTYKNIKLKSSRGQDYLYPEINVDNSILKNDSEQYSVNFDVLLDNSNTFTGNNSFNYNTTTQEGTINFNSNGVLKGKIFADNSSLYISSSNNIDFICNSLRVNGNSLVTFGDKASIASFGLVKPDNSTITISNGVISSKIALPSNTFETLTFGASGTTYTAPANGFYLAHCYPVTDTNGYLRLQVYSGDGLNNLLYWSIDKRSTSNMTTLGCVVPVKKGDKMNLTYVDTTSTNKTLRFIYIEGES